MDLFPKLTSPVRTWISLQIAQLRGHWAITASEQHLRIQFYFKWPFSPLSRRIHALSQLNGIYYLVREDDVCPEEDFLFPPVVCSNADDREAIWIVAHFSVVQFYDRASAHAFEFCQLDSLAIGAVALLTIPGNDNMGVAG